MEGVTQYSGLAGRYFHHLLSQLIKTGNLADSTGKILDFGCGMGQLKRRLGADKVIGYDILPNLSDVADWRTVEFDTFVANQVLYCFTETELNTLLMELKEKSPQLRLVIGISRQGMLNNIGKHLLRRPGAHARTKIGPLREAETLLKHCDLIRRKSVLELSDIYVLKFKN